MNIIFMKLFEMSITATWIILAVLIIRVIFKNIPKYFRCILWAMVGIRLILPFSYECKVSLVPEIEMIQIEYENIHSIIEEYQVEIDIIREQAQKYEIEQKIVNAQEELQYYMSLIEENNNQLKKNKNTIESENDY